MLFTFFPFGETGAGRDGMGWRLFGVGVGVGAGKFIQIPLEHTTNPISFFGLLPRYLTYLIQAWKAFCFLFFASFFPGVIMLYVASRTDTEE